MMSSKRFRAISGWLGTTACYLRYERDQFSIITLCNTADGKSVENAIIALKALHVKRSKAP